MRRLSTSALAESLFSAAASLPFPPTSFAIVPPSWNNVPSMQGQTAPAEVEVALWSSSAGALTAATYYEAIPRALSASALTVTGAAAVAGSLAVSGKTTNCNDTVAAALAGASPSVPGDTITLAFVQSSGAPNAGALTLSGSAWTFTFKGGTTTVANFEAAVAATTGPYALVVSVAGTGANVLQASVDEFAAANLAGAADAFLTHATHGLLTGDGPFQLSDVGGALPTGLAAGTDYWVVKTGANTFSVATSLANAGAGIVVEFSTNGTGTITWTPDASVTRLHWHAVGLLGPADDGAVTLTAQEGSWNVLEHSPDAFACAVGATVGSGTVWGEVRPRVEPF